MPAAAQSPAPIAVLRIDKLLWFIRLATTREMGREWATTGHIRLNGRRVERASTSIRSGDILVMPIRDTVRVIEILVIPHRRGPATEAHACYRYLDTPAHKAPGQAFQGAALTGRA